jgi:two-component system, sensor histidine kinase and response regulator
LFDAIVKALRISIQRGSRSSLMAASAAEPRKSTKRALKILLAEDNLVNQRLAVRLLTKEGHDVVVVTNGEQVLIALEQHSFDLLLMDVQMPEMDGFETTALIREKEQGTPRRLPIIAMTAHALKGDRERCLAAGMDAYVSKPIRRQELFQAIDDVKRGQRAEGQSEEEEDQETGRPGDKEKDNEPSFSLSPRVPVSLSSSSSASRRALPKAVWDKERALARLDNDWSFLQEIVRLFLDDCPARLAEIREAMARGDTAGLHRAAHTLKGALSNLEATTAREAAANLEALAKDGAVANLQAAHATLEEAIHLLNPALVKTLNSPGPDN